MHVYIIKTPVETIQCSQSTYSPPSAVDWSVSLVLPPEIHNTQMGYQYEMHNTKMCYQYEIHSTEVHYQYEIHNTDVHYQYEMHNPKSALLAIKSLYT